MTGSSVETEALVRGFLARTLPKPLWTHEAHLRVGLWHVREYGEAAALDRLRAGIRAYNESVGTANTDASGYHETLTVLYVRLITAFLAAEVAAPEEMGAVERRLLLALGARDLPLRYYSQGRLFSVEARRSWVEPDLAPLP